MTLKYIECLVALGFDFDRHGSKPAIIDPSTLERVSPRLVVEMYNAISQELAKRIQSDVD